MTARDAAVPLRLAPFGFLYPRVLPTIRSTLSTERRTVMAIALLWPTDTTNRFPRVTRLSKSRCSMA